MMVTALLVIAWLILVGFIALVGAFFRAIRQDRRVRATRRAF